MALAVLVERCHGRRIERDGLLTPAVFHSPTVTLLPAAPLPVRRERRRHQGEHSPNESRAARPGACRWAVGATRQRVSYWQPGPGRPGLPRGPPAAIGLEGRASILGSATGSQIDRGVSSKRSSPVSFRCIESRTGAAHVPGGAAGISAGVPDCSRWTARRRVEGLVARQS
jgi:hypothetical protein